MVAVANMGKMRAMPSSSPLRDFGNAADISFGSQFESNGRCYTYDEAGDCADAARPTRAPIRRTVAATCSSPTPAWAWLCRFARTKTHPKRAYFQEARLAPADAWSPAAAAQP